MLKSTKFIALGMAATLLSLSEGAFAKGHKTVANGSTGVFVMPSGMVADHDFVANTVILKVKPQYRSLCKVNGIQNTTLNNILADVGANGIAKIYPHHQQPEARLNKYGQKLVDLSLIYEFKYNGSASIEYVINRVLSVGIFEYVEPHYMHQLAATPNDVGTGQSTIFTNISAYTGWDQTKGDSAYVVGIVDSGTDYTHTDLNPNIKRNLNDPINGTDDDNDNFIDNYRGWDGAMDDNDATYTATGTPHGLHVAGLAAAKTDNANGMAGLGWNTKFIPFKASKDDQQGLSAGYYGIVYCADHGCSAVNCSWGGDGGGQYGQDIVDYAVINKNCLVIAASGNDGLDKAYFPAAYDHVISVASNNPSNNQRSGFSNYNYSVDVMAPGNNNYSCWSGGSYSTQQGTSMAAPMVTGLAGLVKAKFPTYTAMQIGEVIRVTSTDVYSSNSPLYKDKLGKGRINCSTALTATSKSSVVMDTYTITDGNDETYVIGDILQIRGTFINYLTNATGVTATLAATTASAAYVTIVDGSTTLGSINTLASANNTADPFQVQIKTGTPLNQDIQFKLTIADASNTNLQYFTLTVNVDYININIGDVGTTIASNSLIGFSKPGLTGPPSGGIGFTYKGVNMAYESGLMVGVSSTQVSDAVRGGGSLYADPDSDFVKVTAVQRLTVPVMAEVEVTSEFQDSKGVSPLPVTVKQHAYAWSDPGYNRFIIQEYEITNTGANTLNNLYAGIFCDWDIDANSYHFNKTNTDAANKFGYAYRDTTGLKVYAGVKVLNTSLIPNAAFSHYGIDNDSTSDANISTSLGFETDEKYIAISTSRAQAGAAAAGNDVMSVVGTGPYTLTAGQKVTVAFAMMAGDDLADLQTSAANAQQRYLTSINKLALEKGYNVSNVYPNPMAAQAFVDITVPAKTRISVEVYDMLGNVVAIVADGEYTAGKHQLKINAADLANGIYYCRLNAAEGSVTKKFIVAH